MTPQPNQATAVPSPRGAQAGVRPSPVPGTKPGVKSNLKPVEWNGISYPSQTALAQALGVSRATVCRAVKVGRMDTLGNGAWTEAERARGRATSLEVRCQPVAAHGWHWQSQKAAADALGVTSATVSGCLDRGTFDNLVMRRLGPFNHRPLSL